MAATPSNPMNPGTSAPMFSLPNTIVGNELSLYDGRGVNGTIVMFICNHCPFVVHVAPYLSKFTSSWIKKGVSVIAISSNDIENYPEDSPELMKEFASKYALDYPYLYDETQEVAKAYDAACTPDFYLFDKDLKCFYHGQLDASRPKNGIPVTGEDLDEAVNLMLAGQEPPSNQAPSLGCNIKWK